MTKATPNLHPCYLGFRTVAKCPNLCKGDCSYAPRGTNMIIRALIACLLLSGLAVPASARGGGGGGFHGSHHASASYTKEGRTHH